MRKTRAVVTAFLVMTIVVAALAGLDSFVVKAQSGAAISITFDDAMVSQFNRAFPLMQERGMVGTFYAVSDFIRDFSGDSERMSIDELQTIQAAGNEIASHSKSHQHLTMLSDEEIHQECSESQQLLQSYGFPAVNFAYPYGDFDARVSAIADDYYNSARGTYNDLRLLEIPVSQFDVPGFAGETGTSGALARLISAVDQVYDSGDYAIFFFHNVIDGANNQDYVISTEDFTAFLDYVVLRGIQTITVEQARSGVSPLSVTISPSLANLVVGQSQQFTSSVTGGTTPYTYQWYRNGTQISGATGPTYTFTPTSAGTYNIYLVVTGGNLDSAQSNTATVKVTLSLVVSVTPTELKLFFGQSATFSASVSGGVGPYSYQWCLNNSAVAGANSATWTFTPNANGNYTVYLNVTDSLNNRAKSNVVSVNVCSVYLVLNVDPHQTILEKGQQVTLSVTIFNQLNPALDSSLAMAITGPGGYYFYDPNPIKVAANSVREYSLDWIVPQAAGTYIVEVSLVPSTLTAYDTVWLEAA